MTSITQITIPERWPGTSGLLGDKKQESISLHCFMPIDQENYQSAPPAITVDPPTSSAPANVEITDIVTITDSPEASRWDEGLWSVKRNASGYQVSFEAGNIPAAARHGPWTVILQAPGLNVQSPTREPSTDDGNGKVTWSFAPSQHQLSDMTVFLTGPWQVSLNLATDRWPMRWFSDGSFILTDGLLFDLIAIWLGWRLLRWRRQISIPLIGISLLSIACYIGYVIDDYFWHKLSNYSNYNLNNYNDYVHYNHNYNAMWTFENVALVVIAVFYFITALGVRRHWLAIAGVFSAAGTIAIARLLGPFRDFLNGYPNEDPLGRLVILMIPLLSAIALMWAGTVLWISRLWPFGATEWQGRLRKLRDTPFKGPWVIALVLGMFILAAFILGEGAGSAYYAWLHAHFFWQSNDAFHTVVSNLLDNSHWWIGDGLQWPLSFAVTAGMFAALRAMSADERGVFLGVPATNNYPGKPGNDEPRDRGDLALMAAISASLWVGTWGFYDGISIPLPFIVAFVGLAGFGLTRKLSKLDWSEASGLKIDSSPSASGSFLVTHRNDLLTDPVPPDVKLPKAIDPGSTALALGPADTWWDNGVAAVRNCWFLAIIPIAVEIYISRITGNLFNLIWAFGLQDALSNVISMAIAWVSGLFMFGVLLPYLRGSLAPIKGAVFGLIAFVAFAADAAVKHTLGVAPYRFFVVDGLLAIALFATAGILLDIHTLRNYTGDEGKLGSLYRLGSLRGTVAVATTLIVVAVTVWQTIYLKDQTAQERAQNISNTAQYVGGVSTGQQSSPGHR